MNKFFLPLFTLLSCALVAQTDAVLSLKYNAKLFHQNHLSVSDWKHRNLQIDHGNTLIITDTIQLPFFDDFSRNTLRKQGFYEHNIFDSIIYAYGPCDSALNVFTTQGRFHLVQSWDYTFDTINKQLDSTPKAPIVFNYFPNTSSACFDQPGVTFTVWPEFYHYAFDSATGKVLSQKLDTLTADTILTYAPIIYKARLDSNTNWTDNNAFWNTTYPVLPPTIGVATLDGLNEFGLPYDNSSPINLGVADYLTSKPINLSGFSFADSVYLSFFYQSQGIGDWPNRKDSLVLEFFNNYTSNWDVMWSVRGDTIAPNSVSDFRQIMVKVPQTVLPINDYFFSGFQFRFKNYASLAGNNDHWHVDYVRMNAGRNMNDTVISDIAFVYDVPSVLKNYDLMPGKQYTGPSDLADSIKLVVRNNNYDQALNNPPATPYNVDVNLLYPTSSLVFTTNSVFNAGLISEINLTPAASYTLPGSQGDSISLVTKASLAVSNVNLLNDSLNRVQQFDNVLAYDDGSAERAYGLEGLGLKKFAYEFNLNVPDTLVAFQIHYANIDTKVEDLIHSFNVWKNLKLNDVDYVDTPVYNSLNKKPFYIDSVNGFTTYKLDTPLLLNSKFYLGWGQTDVRNLQVGYDLNTTKGRSHMFIFTNGTWKLSSTAVNGSVMIRCIFNHFNGVYSSIKTAEQKDWSIYPNPANNLLYVHTNENTTLHVFNISGQLVMNEQLTGNNALNVSNLEPGIYLLKLTDAKGNLFAARKLVIAR